MVVPFLFFSGVLHTFVRWTIFASGVSYVSVTSGFSEC